RGPVRRVVRVLVVRLVDDEGRGLRRLGDPRIDLRAGRQRAGRVVRVADVDHGRPAGRGLAHPADVVRVVRGDRDGDELVRLRHLVVSDVFEGRLGQDEGRVRPAERL